MVRDKKATIRVQGKEICILSRGSDDFISLDNMVKDHEGGSDLIEQWLMNKETIEFLAVWERENNTDFNSIEFEGIRNEAGTNTFYLSVKQWIKQTNAKGLMVTTGKYGGTFANKYIAFEFGGWLNPKFKLRLTKEFQRFSLKKMSDLIWKGITR